MSRYKSVFSFYGSKSKLVHHYPAPRYPLIIEPFAGGASYSFNNREGHQVWLNDLDDRVIWMWDFLTSQDAVAVLQAMLPDTMAQGASVNDQIDLGGVPYGLAALMRSQANMGTMGTASECDKVTKIGSHGWGLFKRKLLEVTPSLQDWAVTQLHYNHLPNLEATWFIDPPYSNSAGAKYRYNEVNYDRLAAWCQSRRGQVIVAEQAGAAWLPFTPLAHGRVGIRGKYHKEDRVEAIWTNE